MDIKIEIIEDLVEGIDKDLQVKRPSKEEEKDFIEKNRIKDASNTRSD